MDNTKIPREKIETQLPAGCRLATVDDEDGFTCFDWTVVLRGEDKSVREIKTVRVTDAPDPLDDEMDSFFDSGRTSGDTEQRTAGALGLVAR